HGAPRGRAADCGAPEVRTTEDLARALLAAAGKGKRLVSVPVPGRIGHGYATGANLAPNHADGVVTFEQYLAEQGKPTALRYR
ncbi:NAD-dependent epimerase/dehydratase family protein, partial [Amycolatopsis sp. NPDC059090]